MGEASRDKVELSGGDSLILAIYFLLTNASLFPFRFHCPRCPRTSCSGG